MSAARLGGAGRAVGRAPTHAEDDRVLGRAYDARLVRRLREFVLPERPLIILSVSLMFVVMGAQLLQPYLIKLMIDRHFVPGRADGLGVLILAFVAAFGLEMLTRYGQLYSMERTGQNVILALRGRLFSHLQGLDSAFYDRYPVGRLMTRVTTDIESLADLFSSGVVSLLGDSIKLVAIVAILWWLDARLALVTLTVAPVLFLLSYLFRSRIRANYREVRARIARINSYLQEAISGMLLVQLFRRERQNEAEFRRINRDHRDAELTSVVYESSFSALIELIGTLATALIVWYGGGQILRGALTFGTLVAFLEYSGRFFGPLRDLSSFYAVMQSAMASLERIFALLDTQPAIASPADGAVVGEPAAPSPAGPPVPVRDDGSRDGVRRRESGRIEFDRVRFAYHRDEPVLHGVSFGVAPGEKVAVVGATGAGKTTLIKLLIRLYDPTAGAIRLDGIDLRDMPLPLLRHRVGVVMQDHVLVSGTIASNIAFGDRSLSRDSIVEAARLVHADRFIRSLPRTYDEPVRERGGNLSVGQKQLISFARALAYDPEVLVLDEATSSVDSETEALIQDALHRLLANRSAVMIAHRLATIVGADRILVFHHGRLVEEGTHGVLLRRGGIYRRLYDLQFGLDEDDLRGRRPPDATAAADAPGGLPPELRPEPEPL